MLVDDRLTYAERQIDGPGQGRFWGDQWLRVSEKLLKGLNHQFTNRLTSLGALLDLMRPGSPPEEGVVDALSDEVARLGRLLRLYRSLSSDGLSVPEATRLQDIVPMALSLHEHHPDLKYMKCEIHEDAETAPVLVRQAALLRALLVLLENVAGGVMRSESGREMHVSYGNDDAGVWVRFEGTAPSDQLLFSGEGSLLHTVRTELAHAAGTADGTIRREGTCAQLEYIVRLPTLASARRMMAGTA